MRTYNIDDLLRALENEHIYAALKELKAYQETGLAPIQVWAMAHERRELLKRKSVRRSERRNNRLTVPGPEDGGIRKAYINGREVKKNAMNLYWALKKYEDTELMPEEIQEIDKAFSEQAKELMEYRNAEKQGLLLRLPCKVWDKVYIVDDVEKEIEESQVYGIDIDDDGITIMIADNIGTANTSGHTVDEFGKTIFLKREEAEKALAEMED